jgi:hypothetical protein
MADLIKYRTFEQLLEDVSVDFSAYALEGMIEPQQLIKVAMRVNFDLGLRIQRQKQEILDVDKGKVKLPSDYYSLNFAFMTGTYRVETKIPAGTVIEDKILDPGVVKLDENGCPVDSSVCMTDCGDYYQLVQKTKTDVKVYETFSQLKAVGQGIANTCPNSRWDQSQHIMEIRDGYIYTNFTSGKIYINYQAQMENHEGELIVMDHPMVNEYYEYALKQRILENMIFAGEQVSQQLNLIEVRLRAARNNALSFVNTPNYAELQKIWKMNRKAQYDKYVNMFKSTPTIR